MQKKRYIGNIVRIVIFIICISVFIYCVTQIVARYRDLSHAEDVYADLRDKYAADIIGKLPPFLTDNNNNANVQGSGKPNTEGSDTANQNPVLPTVSEYQEFLILQSIVLGIQKDYNECVGYITVSDTNISYPVMKSKTNNEYYLRHLYNGDYSKAGAIFCDYMMSDDYDDNLNVVVYGHDMTNGSMFRSIKLFFDNPDRAEQAKTMEITFVTADCVYIYRFLSGYRSEGNHFISSFDRNGVTAASEFGDFLKKIKTMNTVPCENKYDEETQIITLVTCTNISSRPNERYVLHGILVESYPLD